MASTASLNGAADNVANYKRMVEKLKAENRRLKDTQILHEAQIRGLKRKLDLVRSLASDDDDCNPSAMQSPEEDLSYLEALDSSTSLDEEGESDNEEQLTETPSIDRISSTAVEKQLPPVVANKSSDQPKRKTKIPSSKEVGPNGPFVPRNSHEAGTITIYQDGYHIVWKGSNKGSDSLHDAEGYRYGYYTNGKKTTDREAFWACTGQISTKSPGSSVRSSKRCPMIIHELDGVFAPFGGKKHMPEPHLPRRSSWLGHCPKCHPPSH